MRALSAVEFFREEEEDVWWRGKCDNLFSPSSFSVSKNQTSRHILLYDDSKSALDLSANSDKKNVVQLDLKVHSTKSCLDENSRYFTSHNLHSDGYFYELD